MMVLLQLTRGLLAVLLAASLVACGSDNAAPADTGAAPQPQAVANDCRSPHAQTTQRGCRPVTRTMGSL